MATGQWAVQGAAAGIFVTAAAKPLGDGGHVHPPLAAQAEADVVVAQFAQKDRNLDPGDADGIVDDPFAVLLRRVGAIHIVFRDPKPCQVSIVVQVGQRGAQQKHLWRLGWRSKPPGR